MKSLTSIGYIYYLKSNTIYKCTMNSSDSEDIGAKELLLVLVSVMTSASLFCCYLKYMIKYHPGEGTTQIIRPAVNNSDDIHQQL